MQSVIIQQRASVETREKLVEVPRVVLQDVVQEVPQVLVQERIVEVPEVSQVESIRQVPGNISYEDRIKEILLPTNEPTERLVEVPTVLHEECLQEVPQVQQVDVFKEVLRPNVQMVAKHVEKVVAQVIERSVPVTVPSVREKMVEVPRIDVVEFIKEVPVYETKQVDKEVRVVELELQEKIVQVPLVEIQEEIVEVPTLEEGTLVKEVPKYDVQFIDKKVEKPIIEWVEKIVEVPHITYEERLVYVPEVEIREVVRQVPKALVQYVDVQVPKRFVQFSENVIEMPTVLTEEVPYEVPTTVVVETRTEVPLPEYQAIPREVLCVQIQPREVTVEEAHVVKAERVVEMPQVQFVDLRREVVCERIEHVEKRVPRLETQIVERVQEVPTTLIEEVIIEVPRVQLAEAITEQGDARTMEVVKEIPKVTPSYVEKVVEVGPLVPQVCEDLGLQGSQRTIGHPSAPSSLRFSMTQAQLPPTFHSEAAAPQPPQRPASPRLVGRGSIAQVVVPTLPAAQTIQMQTTGMPSIVQARTWLNQPRSVAEASIVGSWLYEEESYDISMHENGELLFTQQILNRFVSGVLIVDGSWLVTTLCFEDGEVLGMIRLRLQDGTVTSNFKKPMEKEWEEDVVAVKSPEMQQGPSSAQLAPLGPSSAQLQRNAGSASGPPGSASGPPGPPLAELPPANAVLASRGSASVVHLPPGLQVPPGTPIAVAAIDSNNSGLPNYLYIGVDRNQDGIPDALQNQTMTVYLPKVINGRTVLVQEGHDRWRTTNPDSQARFGGLSYRKSKQMEDRLEEGLGPVWGVVLDGVDEGDGWVRLNVASEAPSVSPLARVPPLACPQLPLGLEVLAGSSVREMPSGPRLQPGPPVAAAAVDTNHDGHANFVYVGVDRNQDGIPDALQAGPASAVRRTRSLGSSFRNPRLASTNAVAGGMRPQTPRSPGSLTSSISSFRPQLEATALSSTAASLHAPMPLEPDAPGRYRIVGQEAFVSLTIRLGGTLISRLQQGEEVMVVDVLCSSEDHRIRGRLQNPAGWISLLNTQTGYRWAERVAPDTCRAFYPKGLNTEATHCSCGNAFMCDSVFCRRCGKPRGAPTHCYCGNAFMSDSLFCRKCGRPRPKAPDGVETVSSTGAPLDVAKSTDAPSANCQSLGALQANLGVTTSAQTKNVPSIFHPVI